MAETLVISGLGLVSAYGLGTDAFLRGLHHGVPRPSSLTGSAAAPLARGEQAILPDGGAVLAGNSPRRARLLDTAMTEAFGPLPSMGQPEKTLLVLVGQAPEVAHAGTGALDEDSDILELTSGWTPTQPGVTLHEQVFLSHACASILFGLAYAREWILGGLGDAAVVAGAFTVNRYEHLGMQMVGALSAGKALPFDTSRDGTSLGEGSAAVLVRREAATRARGLRPLARIGGLACRIGGHSRSNSDQGMISSCMADALTDANVEHIDYVHAHATGTVQGDLVESAALDDLGAGLGWRDVPVSSHKGAVGHLMHASAGAGLVAGVGALMNGIAPGTPGLRDPLPTGPATRLIKNPEPLPGSSAILVNSFGFAGNNASIVLVQP